MHLEPLQRDVVRFTRGVGTVVGATIAGRAMDVLGGDIEACWIVGLSSGSDFGGCNPHFFMIRFFNKNRK